MFLLVFLVLPPLGQLPDRLGQVAVGRLIDFNLSHYLSLTCPIALSGGWLAKQPFSNDLSNSLKTLIADPLSIDTTHRAIDVAHDVIEGYLIFGFATYRLARSAKPIEAPSFDVEVGIDAQLPKAFRDLTIW